MSGTIKKVFIVIGVLVLCLIIWSVFFSGALGQLWTGMASQLNDGWHTVAGDDASDIINEEFNTHDNATVGDQKGEVALNGN